MKAAVEWQFGGILGALHPLAAWGLLALSAIAGVWLIIRLYGRTLRKLDPPARTTLVLLRAGLLLLVFLCLANPVRVEAPRSPEPGRDALAVLVDYSASMNSADHRGLTRLGDAARTWTLLKEGIGADFPQISHHRFAGSVVATAGFDDALRGGTPGGETLLYSSLRGILSSTPAAVVALTDGLDTSEENPDALVREALQRRVPLYFVVGQNRLRPAETLAIRALKVPRRVLRQSEFTAVAVMQAGTAQAGSLPVELWSGETKLAETTLPLRTGLNTLAWPVTVKANEPGMLPLEFRAGAGLIREISACTAQVVTHTEVNTLYYQGAFQWGFPFLVAALESDPGFRVTAILNPSLHVQTSLSSKGGTMPRDLPDTAEALQPFHIVVLSHVFADQLSSRQQNALVEYARNGGSVLFVTQDTEAASRFAGTPLEKMLPVVFEPPKPKFADDLAERQFQDQMAAIGGASSSADTRFANSALRQQQVPPLHAFAQPQTRGAASRLFRHGPEAPRFSDYAAVRQAKSGAEIIAVHPSDRDPSTGDPRVLIARQRFGDGYTAAMTTDLLWRWKMSLPSGSRVAEVFWQQFLLSLAQPGAGGALRFLKSGESAGVGHTVSVQLESLNDTPFAVEAISPLGTRQPLIPKPGASGEDEGPRSIAFTPDVEGRWDIVASTTEGAAARTTINISKSNRTLESSNLPPDMQGLRRIAEATGGAILDRDNPLPDALVADPQAPTKNALPLWHSPWLLAALLGFYAAELIVRRLCRLL